eukprot:Awhi_evm1s14255
MFSFKQQSESNRDDVGNPQKENLDKSNLLSSNKEDDFLANDHDKCSKEHNNNGFDLGPATAASDDDNIDSDKNTRKEAGPGDKKKSSSSRKRGNSNTAANGINNNNTTQMLNVKLILLWKPEVTVEYSLTSHRSHTLKVSDSSSSNSVFTQPLFAEGKVDEEEKHPLGPTDSSKDGKDGQESESPKTIVKISVIASYSFIKAFSQLYKSG